MRVRTIETFKVPPRWLFVRIETESGLVGWGEPIVEGRADTVAAAVHEMTEYVVGRDAGHIEDIFQVLYRGAFYRGGPVLMSAISGIEQALWDIKGKSLNVPVYSLFGGPVRDKMKVYTWIGGDSPSDASRGAIERLRQGFTAVKMNATANMDWVDSHRKVTEAVERVQAVREAVGDKLDIAVDFHGRVHKPMAAVLMKELEPLDCCSRGACLGENQKRSWSSRGSVLFPLQLASATSGAGRSRICCTMVEWTSSSLISATQAESLSVARSRQWLRHTMWLWHHTALLAQSRLLHACNLTSALPTLSSRSRVSKSTTTRDQIF